MLSVSSQSGLSLLCSNPLNIDSSVSPAGPAHNFLLGPLALHCHRFKLLSLGLRKDLQILNLCGSKTQNRKSHNQTFLLYEVSCQPFHRCLFCKDALWAFWGEGFFFVFFLPSGHWGKLGSNAQWHHCRG